MKNKSSLQAKPHIPESGGSVRIQLAKNADDNTVSVDDVGERSPRKSPRDTQSDEQSKPNTFPGSGDDAIDIAEFDRRANEGLIPLSMVAIPVPYPGGGNPKELRLTQADRQRRAEIQAQVTKWAEEEGIRDTPATGYQSVNLDERKTVYVRPDLVESYKLLLEEDKTIHARNMRSTSSNLWYTEPSKGLGSADGTRVEYYRRRDGALIRSIKRPDGSVTKAVIGWASADPKTYGVPADLMQRTIENNWREE